MNSLLKKLLVLLPVLVLGLFYLQDHAETYRHVKQSRLLLLSLSLFLLYGLILWEVISRKQDSFVQILTQSGFYVYIFMVLTLTGYFILFREISVHNWWHKMIVRIDRKDHVNLHLFKMFHIYRLASTQIVGNFIMLLPLGIFLPLLYRKLSSFFPVFLVALSVSTAIELLQLVTSFRSADVDDVFLNTLGACTGFVLYKFFLYFTRVDESAQELSLAESPMA